MAFGVLGFGLCIAGLTGVYRSLMPAQPLWSLGPFGFLALAAAICGGNRWLRFKQRQHFACFSHPLRKLLMLVSANVLYTTAITLLGLLRRRPALPGPAMKLFIAEDEPTGAGALDGSHRPCCPRRTSAEP